MLTTLDYIFIALYFIIILIVGFWTGHKEEKEDYLIAGRKLKSFEATTTIFSSRIGAAILLTYTALVYLYGLGAYWYFIGSVLGLFVFYFFGKKIKKLGDEQKFYTLSDFFFYLKGPVAGYLSAVVVMIIMFGWVVLNFTAGAKLVQEYTPISYDWSVIIIGVIILAYLLAGGFKAVVKTDIIQTLGIFLLFILMIYLLVNTDTKPKIIFSDLFNIPTKEIINFFLAGFFIPMASPELWQRVYAIENQKHYKRSILLSSVFYFIIGFILLMIGMVIRIDIPDISADTALIVGFSRLLPVGLAGLSVIIIYSAVSSSADTYMFTAASTVTQDFLEKSGVLKKEKLFMALRIIMVLLMVLGVVMALVLRDIVDTTFFFVSLTMSLGFLVLVIWIYPKINKYSVNLSILFCLIGVIVPAILIGISTSLVIYAVSLCIAGLILGLIIYWIKPSA
ncbi:MAG: sodium:solute symporter family protein [Bacteroidales bacterium]|nr:sodium:solute symporter family protein [Bacteroidales bacterium]